MPTYTNIIKKLSSDVPFVGPETQERKLGKKFMCRLGANESVFGPSANVIHAMKSCLEKDIWQYGDPENFDLKVALQEKYYHHLASRQNYRDVRSMSYCFTDGHCFDGDCYSSNYDCLFDDD